MGADQAIFVRSARPAETIGLDLNVKKHQYSLLINRGELRDLRPR